MKPSGLWSLPRTLNTLHQILLPDTPFRRSLHTSGLGTSGTSCTADLWQVGPTSSTDPVGLSLASSLVCKPVFGSHVFISPRSSLFLEGLPFFIAFGPSERVSSVVCLCHKLLKTRARDSRNVVVLGSLGVGKSSLVNMLIGRAVAPVSSDIGVVHPAVVEYPVTLSEISGDEPMTLFPFASDLTLRFFDTLGLDYRPSPWDAIKARLKRSGGVDLVVYCMRRGRLSSEQLTHLRTIWRTFCRGDVPLVLVVGGVDYRRGSTEKWWETNGEDLANAVQVSFADHVCLNTWESNHPSWNHQGMRYEETQRFARDLVIRHCKSLH